MIRQVKRWISRALAHFGYILIKRAPPSEGNQPFAKPSGKTPAWGAVNSLPPSELVPALREIIKRVQPSGQPPIDDYQLEMAAYGLRTGMGDAEPGFFPI